jgi:hypothetical protein
VQPPGGAPTCTGTGARAVGPSDVALSGGRLSVAMGLGGDLQTRSQLPADVRDVFGTVRTITRGTTTPVADLTAYEASANPIGDVDSNPYGLEPLAGGSFLATDAGGNDLVRVTPPARTAPATATATVRTVATFPDLAPRPFVPPSCAGSLPPGTFPPAGTPLPAQAVPTSVTAGSNGTYYVGLLTGFPFTQGAASVLRVSPSGRTSVLAGGLTTVVGVDLASDGALYALELGTTSMLEAACGTPVTGDVVRIVHGKKSVVATGLPDPGGIGVAPDGSFYVSVHSTAVGDGELWHFGRPRR